jgi:hypothetical protein
MEDSTNQPYDLSNSADTAWEATVPADGDMNVAPTDAVYGPKTAAGPYSGGPPPALPKGGTPPVSGTWNVL